MLSMVMLSGFLGRLFADSPLYSGLR
jgi:hypothetical protein